jgi:hypothetical protein
MTDRKLKSSPVLRLVPKPNKISHDTIEALEALLAGAKSGDITGIAFAATVNGGRYITDCTGRSCEYFWATVPYPARSLQIRTGAAARIDSADEDTCRHARTSSPTIRQY